MKNKVWIFIISAFFIINTGYSQRFKGGAHIGLLATQVEGDELSGYKKAGLFLGVFANIPFEEKKLKVQLEIDYAQKGSKSPASSPDQYKIALHQIEVPVTVGWNLWKELSVEAGLSLNIIASAKEYTHNELVPHNAGGSKFNLFELGAIGGVSYCFKEHFALFFRMNFSISPIGKSTILRGVKLERYMCNNAMLFGVSYQF